jgi:septal ring-binding cell division protein DamX
MSLKKSFTNILSTLALSGVVALLAACESGTDSSYARTKSDSPWGKRTAAVTDSAEAPASASETYKQELSDIEIGSTEPKPIAVKKPAPVVTAAESEAGGDDFKNVAPGYYTLQVLASVDKKAIYKFAKEHQLSTRYVVPTVRGATTWHVLLLDVYPDKAAAKAAMENAAASLPAKPWMRSVASVQKLMP